jgi:uncharacterized protein (TIGR03435 family)
MVVSFAGKQHHRVDRPIVDRTGLTGTFEWELISGIRLDGPEGRWIPPDAPPLDTALRDQLGLRLEAQTARSEVFVTDSVQMPTQNQLLAVAQLQSAAPLFGQGASS